MQLTPMFQKNLIGSLESGKINKTEAIVLLTLAEIANEDLNCRPLTSKELADLVNGRRTRLMRKLARLARKWRGR